MNTDETIKTNFRQSLSFYKPNAKGTGAAIKFDLHPANGQVNGFIVCTLATQATTGDRRGPEPVYPTFDWDGSIVFKLGFDDICKFMQVFFGECESLEEGRGLYHQSVNSTTSIGLRHMIEYYPCYELSVEKTDRESGESKSGLIYLSTFEALGLLECFKSSLSLIAFGVPSLVPVAD